MNDSFVFPCKINRRARRFIATKWTRAIMDSGIPYFDALDEAIQRALLVCMLVVEGGELPRELDEYYKFFLNLLTPEDAKQILATL